MAVDFQRQRALALACYHRASIRIYEIGLLTMSLRNGRILRITRAGWCLQMTESKRLKRLQFIVKSPGKYSPTRQRNSNEIHLPISHPTRSGFKTIWVAEVERSEPPDAVIFWWFAMLNPSHPLITSCFETASSFQVHSPRGVLPDARGRLISNHALRLHVSPAVPIRRGANETPQDGHSWHLTEVFRRADCAR